MYGTIALEIDDGRYIDRVMYDVVGGNPKIIGGIVY
jgi:hypothetical protein